MSFRVQLSQIVKIAFLHGEVRRPQHGMAFFGKGLPFSKWVLGPDVPYIQGFMKWREWDAAPTCLGSNTNFSLFWWASVLRRSSLLYVCSAWGNPSKCMSEGDGSAHSEPILCLCCLVDALPKVLLLVKCVQNLPLDQKPKIKFKIWATTYGCVQSLLLIQSPSDHKALRASRMWAPWKAASATVSAAQSLGITAVKWPKKCQKTGHILYILQKFLI